MNWFERYLEEIQSLEPPDFAEELRVAAEDFLLQGFRVELETWVTSDPDDFWGAC